MNEVELRGTISLKEYERLKYTFEKEGTVLGSSRLFSIMYSGLDLTNEVDLRCRITNKIAELVVKTGQQDSSSREETTFKFDKNEFLNVVTLLSKLGYNKGVGGIRVSERYVYKNVEFSLVKPIALKSGKTLDKNLYYEAEILAKKGYVNDARLKIIKTLQALRLTVLKESKKDILKLDRDDSLVSNKSFYDLVQELNEDANVILNINTEQGMKLIKKALVLCGIGLIYEK